jgi:hypothetical protein
MAVTMKEVREALDPEEPNYQRAMALGPEALPHLEVLVGSDDPMLASKATYLASLIEDARAADVVQKAARSPDPVVRVAAAAAAPNLGAGGAGVLRELAADSDPGVRKVARSKGRAERAAPPPESAERRETRPQAAPIVVGRMPGEDEDAGDAARAPSAMPGAAPGGAAGVMPGERQDSDRGLMPGERPGGTVPKGEMPR